MPQDAQEKLISPTMADRLIAAHDGDVALLYIFRARTGCMDAESAARALCRTRREVDAAEEKLQRLLVGGAEAAPRAPTPAAQEAAPAHAVPPAPAEELPQYSTEDVVRRSRSDGEFAAIAAEAARVMGRVLGSVDLKKLFGIYDYLGLPPEVIMLLIHYCGRQYELKYGTQKRPSAHAIEKEAYIWANREIMTVEQAEEYIRRADERRCSISAAREAIGIKGRELTKTERGYVEAWLDMGFTGAELSIAYDRTVTNTGARKWNYMNRILQSWHEAGLHTAAEIEAHDSRRKKQAPPAASQSTRGSRPADFEDLDSLIDKI